MSGGIKVEGAITTNQLEVNTNHFVKTTCGDYNRFVNMPYKIQVLERVDNDDTRRNPESSRDYRKRISLTTPLFQEIFPASTALNTNQWNFTNTTMTGVPNTNAFVLNNSGSVAINAYYLLKSWRTFSGYASVQMALKISASITSPYYQQGNKIEFGFGLVAGTAAPTDGAFWRFDVDGTLKCVVLTNTNEQIIIVKTLPTLNTEHGYVILFNNQDVEFWIDDVLVATILIPRSAGVSINSMSCPIFIRNLNVAATASAVKFSVFGVFANSFDLSNLKESSHIYAGMGRGSYVPQVGMSMISTSNWLPAAAPTTTTPVTGTPCYTTLGGHFALNALATSENNYPIYSFTPTAATNAIQGTNLYITDITITSCVIGAAIDATTTTIHEWSVSIGTTGLFNTVEGQGTKIPRTSLLGIQNYPISSAIGKQSINITKNFIGQLGLF